MDFLWKHPNSNQTMKAHVLHNHYSTLEYELVMYS